VVLWAKRIKKKYGRLQSLLAHLFHEGGGNLQRPPQCTL
jgi:hypothetical protein